MKVGDRVKILVGDHSQEGEVGIIMKELEPHKNPTCAWNFEVAMNGDIDDPICFFDYELEVIDDTV